MMTTGRTKFLAGLAGILLLTALVAGSAGAADESVLTVQGESAARSTIPTAPDPEAAGGKYLALDTADDPPADGWYATYEVDAPADGIYRLDAVITSPAMSDRLPFGGSYFDLAVNDGPFTQVAKSEPYWASEAENPTAWGSLVRAPIDDVELQAGANTTTFRVDELRSNASPQLDDPPGEPAPPGYRFFLDEFTLTSTDLALESLYLGDPDTNIGTYRGDDVEPLHFRLNGHAADRQTVNYTITDYFTNVVASGTATVPAGATAATVDVPELPVGSYWVTASRAAAPDDAIVGHFARLPDQEATGGPDGKFAVTTTVPWLVPSSKLDAFASAMNDAGAGYAREEISWPLAEPEPGAYDTRAPDHIAATFREHGLHTLGTLWHMAGTGNVEAPSWATTPDSDLLPADLRDGYAFANYLAGQTDGIGGDALELWNEPDVDVAAGSFTRSTGDQHAAYLKAAALGVADATGSPLVSLSGIAFPGAFHEVMLQNEVLRYADVWAYHGYADHGWDDTAGLPREPWIHNDLRRLYDAPTEMWMTEAGKFITPEPAEDGEEINPTQQRDQARYLVQSTVDSLAAGTDKHFWYSGAPYCASGYACFGLLSRDFQPWPAYSAYAALTSILGTADHLRPVGDLPPGVTAHAFDNDGQEVTVLWGADAPTDVRIPVSGDTVDVYNIMGERQETRQVEDGSVDVTAAPDPSYLVSDGPRENTAADASPSGTPTTAERIVLNQRFTADAAPEPPPFGYRLAETTEMSVEVYNFNDAPQNVTVTPKAFGGWSVEQAPQTITVAAGERVSVPFTIHSGDAVAPGVDYPLVFDATLDDDSVPPSVSRIHLAAEEPGEPIELAPAITDLSPADGETVTGPEVTLAATVTDPLSGIDPDRIRVEVDGEPVRHRYHQDTGQLTADLHLAPGRHTISVRAHNNAHAPALTTADIAVTPAQ